MSLRRYAGFVAALVLCAGVAYSIDGDLARNSHPFKVVAGAYAQNKSIQKFGNNPTIDAASAEDIWYCPELGANTAYPWTAMYSAGDGQLVWVSSDDAADADPVSVIVTGINEDWEEDTVTVPLTGLTFAGVSSTSANSKWLRIYRVKVVDETNGVLNAGNIYLSHDATDAGGDGIPDDTATIVGCVMILAGQTQMAMYTVPEPFTGYVTEICYGVNKGGGVAASVDVTLSAKINAATETSGLRIQHTMGVASAGTSSFCRGYDPPLRYPPRTDLVLKAATSQNGTEVHGEFTVWLVDE